MLRRLIAIALACLPVCIPSVVFAESAIQELVSKTLTPQPGAPTTFEVGVTSSDTTIWPAGSYTVQLIASDPAGNTITSSDPVPGDEPATPGQTSVLFITLTIPNAFAGPVNVQARLTHGSTVDVSAPIAIVVGATPVAAGAPLAAPPPGTPPTVPIPVVGTSPGPVASPGAAPAAPESPPTETAPPAPPAPPPGPPPAKKITGTIGNNETFGATGTQAGTLNLSGSLPDGASYTATSGLATTPGGNKTLVAVQTQCVLTQIGTFSPTFDRDVFAGPTGAGVDIKRIWGATHLLQLAVLAGDAATTNPYEMAALSYSFPAFGNPFEVTGGVEQQDGPAQPGNFFLREGRFGGFGWDLHAPHSSLTYGIHFGDVDYLDSLTNTVRTGDVVDLSLGFVAGATRFSFGYVRATPYYANLSASGVTPDKETETAAVTLPLGPLQANFSFNGYRDDLPGSPLLQETHFYTEMASLLYPFKNGDSVAFQASNGIQHQTGDPVAPFSGNDSESLAYTTKRGAYSFQYTLTSTNQRDNSGQFLHVVSDALNVSRTPFGGVTLSTGFNLTNNEANVDESTSISSSVTGSVSYVRGPYTLSTQLNHSFSHPYIGLSSPATTSYNYGLSYRAGNSPYSLTGTVTENIGMINSSSGALSLSRQF